TAAWSRCSTPGWRPPATAATCARPCRRSGRRRTRIGCAKRSNVCAPAEFVNYPASMSRRHAVVAVIATCAALLVAACTTTLQGKAVSVFDDPFHVAGMPATDGPTGLRPDAQGPARDVEGTDNGAIDEPAGNAVHGLQADWGSAYSETFDGQFTPVEALISWDANGFD